MGVQRRSAEEWRELVPRLIAERALSGETWRSISARTGIHHATLTGWLWRLRREQRDSAQAVTQRPEFIELVPTDSNERSSSFEVVLRGDRRLRVEAHFDEAALTRLVRALEAC